MKPQGAIHFAYGQWFKIGGHNLLMRWTGDQWVRSTLNLAEVRREGRSAKVEAANNSGRKPIPLIDGKKECRGKHGCGEFKQPHEFFKDSRGYRMTHCRACEARRQQTYKAAA